METLSIIGCGHLGKSLGRLWTKNELLAVKAVLNRTKASGLAAVGYLGQGRAVESFQELPASDFVMLSVSDDAIESCCQQLAASRTLKPGSVVFHCSGSLSSQLLDSAKNVGAMIASLHPLRSFADPTASADTFAGTPCGIEGDEAACELLTRLVEGAGGQVFRLKPETKLFYHAGTVMVCNYFTALMEAGLQCYEKAGISRESALNLIRPILQETLANNLKSSPAQALTGPIARGDFKLVSKQFEAMAQWNPTLGDLYKAAGLVALDLAQKKGLAKDENLQEIDILFRNAK